MTVALQGLGDYRSDSVVYQRTIASSSLSLPLVGVHFCVDSRVFQKLILTILASLLVF